MNTQITIVKKGMKWAPIVNGKQLQAFDAITVCLGLEAFTLLVNEKTVEAPKDFWAEIENAPAQGGID